VAESKSCPLMSCTLVSEVLKKYQYIYSIFNFGVEGVIDQKRPRTKDVFYDFDSLHFYSLKEKYPYVLLAAENHTKAILISTAIR
jgi:hypothetical protein